MTVDEDDDREARFVHHVSFRLTDEQAARANALRATFRHGRWSEVGRWLFSDPEVGEIIARRVRGE